MKKVIIAAAFVMGAGMVHAQTATNAQAATATVKPMPAQMQRAMPAPADVAKRQTDRMGTMLNLSEAQKKTMYKANLDFSTKIIAARQTKDRTAFEKAMTERNEQYKKILTPDQYAKFSQMMPQHPAKPVVAPTAPAPVK